MTRNEAARFANEWIEAWNSHDLDAILRHYDNAIELTSPVAAQLLGRPDGRVTGIGDLRAYFQRGLDAYPDLHFELDELMWGVGSVVLYYRNQRGTRSGEFMELSTTGKVTRVVAHYNA